MRAIALTLAALAAALTAATALASPPTIAKRTPAATLLAENAAFNAREWKTLYSAYTKNYKSHCPYATFVAGPKAARDNIGTFSARVTNVRIVGSRAYLAYQILHAGKVLFTVKPADPDVYVRQGGLWYDESSQATAVSRR